MSSNGGRCEGHLEDLVEGVVGVLGGGFMEDQGAGVEGVAVVEGGAGVEGGATVNENEKPGKVIEHPLRPCRKLSSESRRRNVST